MTLIIVAAGILLLIVAVTVCSSDIDGVTSRKYHKGDTK